MPRVGLSPAAVVDHALELIDEQGTQALTLAAVVARAKVATPSLYKHVPGGLAELRRMVAVRATEELADRLAHAALGRSTDDAVTALLAAYAAYATEYPQRYAAVPQAPQQDDPEQQEAATRLVTVVLRVLHGYGLDGAEAIHATRTVRAMAHGFASLTTGGAFQLAEDQAVTLERMTRVLIEGLRSWPRDGGAGATGAGA